MQNERVSGLFDLVIRNRLRGEICGGSRLNHDICIVRMGKHRFTEFFGAFDHDSVYMLGRLQMYRARGENHICAALFGCRRDGVAHLTRRTVRDKAHGIDSFHRRSGGHQNGFSDQILFWGRQEAIQRIDNFIRFAHSTDVVVSAGQMAGLRTFKGNAAQKKRLHIRLRRRISPHGGIHRGANQFRRSGCQKRCGEQIVRNAVGHFGQNIRSRRRNHHRIRPFGERHVFDFKLALKCVRIRGISGKRFKRKRRNK